MTRYRIGLARVALVAMVMTGCNSGASPAATPAGSTPTPAAQTTGTPTTPVASTGDHTVPCDTLRPQVKTIVGGTFYTGDDADINTDTECSYTFVDADSGLPSGGSVDIRLETGQYESNKAAYPDAVDLTGVGDRAFWSDRFGVLCAEYRGAMWVVQIVQNGPITDRKGVATQLMQALFATM